MSTLHIPQGYQILMPYLIIGNAGQFFEFIQSVFDATEKMRVLDDDKTIMHAELQISGHTVMYADASEKFPVQNAGLYVHVSNADEAFKKALAAGAKSIEEPTDKEHGRACGIKDPFGNTWWIVSVK